LSGVVRVAGAASAAILLAACGVTPSPQPDGRQPVIVTGVVVDGAGRPLAGANVRLDARDWMTVEHDVATTGFATGGLTDVRGRFEVRGLPPTPSAMDRSSGSIEFELTAGGPVWCMSDPYTFLRSGDFEAQTWKEPAPDLRLTASNRCDALPGTS
jgi:hypothetical protein